MPALGNKGVSGGGVVKPAVIKAAAKRAAPPIRKVPASAPVSVPSPKVYAPKPQRPAPRLFSQPLKSVTKQNMKTGAAAQQVRAQNPQKYAPKQSLFQKALGVLGTGEHFLEHAASEGIGELEKLPGVGSRTGVNKSVTERKAQRNTYGSVGVQAAEALGTAGLGAALSRGGEVAARGSELADKQILREVAQNALKARDLAPLDRAPTTAKALDQVQGALEQTGARTGSSAASRALKVAGGAATGYAKLLGGATAAKAAIGAASTPPKKNEGFVSHFWNSALHTVANLPAGAIEGVFHPVKTAEAMGHLYTHPEKAFNENPFGTLLAFLAPAAGVERGAGGAVRLASGGKLLSRERPNLEYASGANQAREYQPGLVSGLAQRAPDALMKGIGKGEKPLESGSTRAVNRATRLQERRDILGSRMGGIIRPGQVDLIRGGERLARNLEVMKAHHFLDQHLPHDPVHATALMTLLQGEAKTAGSFWPDVAERVATLKHEAKNLTGTDLAYNKQQVEQLTNMELNRSKISHADLEHYEKAAAQIAQHQREKWTELNQEGIGHPNQLNARNLTAVLTHGHLMGRGELHFEDNPGPHPLVSDLKRLKDQRKQARTQVQKYRTELKISPPPRGVKVGQHYKLKELAAHLDYLNEAIGELSNKVSTAKYAGALKPNGDRFPGVVDEHGTPVTAAETEQFIHEHFGREMGFITHKQDLARARSQNTYGPRTVYPMRTGGNFMAGAYDNSPAALRNHFERGARNLAAMRGRRSVAENLVRMKEDGKPFTELQAKSAADNMNRTKEGDATKPHLGEWVPYNLGAEKTAQLVEGHPYTKELEHQGLIEHKAILEEGKGAATYGILPQKVADRLNKWDNVEKQVQGSMLRQMTTPWRQTNLYTSVRWPFGTTQENMIRLAAHQVSPLTILPRAGKTSLSFGTGSHIIEHLDEKINDPSVPHAQKQLALMHKAQFGTGNFVGSQLHELEPALHDLTKDSFWGKVSENPLNTKGWRPYRRAIGNTLNRMETNAKIAAGGKLALNDAKFFDKFRKIDREQAAKNYVNKITTDPAESIKAAGDLMEVMGNWNHLTPYTRQAQAEWAPFALWWLNSAKFIFKTLPRDHPYATGLLAAMVTATGQGNRNLKPYLEGTIPLKLPYLGEINLNPVHYSPFDIAAEPVEKAGSMVAPQIVEPSMTLKGVDPLTGEKFVGDKKGEAGEGTAAARTGVTALESYIPGLRLASQLAGEGGIPSKTTIFPWEDTHKLGLGKAALKTVAPFKFTYVRKKSGGGGTASPPVGGGFGGKGGNTYQGKGGFTGKSQNSYQGLRK